MSDLSPRPWMTDAEVAESTRRANDEWDRLRALLKPCPKCGEAKELLFKCAQMCATASVYCGRCGLNTMADHQQHLMAYGEPGTDARPAAVEKWNAVARP